MTMRDDLEEVWICKLEREPTTSPHPAVPQQRIGLPNGSVGVFLAFESEQAARECYPDSEPMQIYVTARKGSDDEA